jgi:tripartite-type tricarboxylate transporter receptor subunit TctC
LAFRSAGDNATLRFPPTPRRHPLGLAASTDIAGAQQWPDKPVRIIVPFPPGGATDAIARPWAEELTKAFGQQFVIENRGGAGGSIGTEAVARAPADGYTLLLVSNSAISMLPLVRPTPYDPQKDLTPVARVGDVIGGFVVQASTGIKTFQELVDYAKKNPGKLTFGSAGAGTATHFRLEKLRLATGLDILHVPYRGSGDALTDLLAGNIQMMNEVVVYPHVKSGKLNLLAINYATRHPEFPNVPTLTELGIKDSDVPIWFTLWAPDDTPAAIVNAINAKAKEIASNAAMQARMREISVVMPIQTPDEIKKHLAEDLARNREIVKAANIRIDG